MKYTSFVKRIFFPIIFWAAVCPVFFCSGFSATAASDSSEVVNDSVISGNYSITIGDDSSSVFIENATVTENEDGQLHISLSHDAYQDLGSALSTSSENASDNFNEEAHTPADPISLDRKDGDYSIELTLTGGSGKASVVSPCILTVKDGKAYAELIWSSSNYDYMIAAGETYLNESEEGAASQFHIPITKMDEEMSVIADTTAMGTPHEVNYAITFFSNSIGSTSQMPKEAAKRVIFMALFIIIAGGILNRRVNKKKK